MQELQESLDQSWDEEEELLEFQHSHHASSSSLHQSNHQNVSSLALNLSSQTEYNNELLEYIQHLEGKYQESQVVQTKLEGKLEEAQRRASEESETAQELNKKLLHMTNLYEELTERFSATGSDMTEATSEIDTLRGQLEEAKQQKLHLEESQSTYSDRVMKLEAELSDLKRKRLVSDDDCTDKITTLNISLEKAMSELERERKLHYELQLQTSLLKDENIQLTRRVEHFVKVGQEDDDERESMLKQLKEAKASVAYYQHETNKLRAECEQLEQSLSVCKVRLKESDEARWEAVDSSQKTDVMWREMEEYSKRVELENQELKKDLESYAEKKSNLEHRILARDEKEKQMEQLLKDEYDRKSDIFRKKLEDMQEQLNRSKRRLEEVNDHKDRALAASTSRVEELNKLLEEANHQLHTRSDVLKRQKADEESRVLQLEKIIQDLRDQLKKAVQDEREAMKEKVQELIVLREQQAVRSGRYSSTLAGLHDVLHAVTSEAAQLREQLAYLHHQQEKFVFILQHMSSRSEEENDDSNSRSTQSKRKHSNPILGPLHDYSREMRRVLSSITEKLKQSREAEEHSKRLADDRFHEIQQLNFEKTELQGQLELSEDRLRLSRSKATKLESQVDETQREMQMSLESSQLEREKLTKRLDNSENRLTDMLRQNTSLQADLRRAQSEAAAAQQEAEARYNMLSNKLVGIAAERDESREKEHRADERHSQLQNQLMQADARIAKQQAEYRKLKKISLSLKEDLTQMTTSSREQVSSLSQAMEQYRQQLEHKQQLINALQEQRNELASSNERLHQLMADLREGKEEAAIALKNQHLWKPKKRYHDDSSAMNSFVSSSTASSSRKALSGLAQLVHSRGSRGSHAHDLTAPMTVVHGSDLGSGVFNANIRHLTASLNQVDSSRPFRVPAMGSDASPTTRSPDHSRHDPEQDSHPLEFKLPESSFHSQLTGKDSTGSKHAHDDVKDIFRLTSPSKYSS